MAKKGGRYRIQAVSEMTGLPAATLRSWERRYGIPLPARTSSAYRLYSDDDIEHIVKLRDLTRSGMAPSEAARSILAAAERASSSRPTEEDPYLTAQERLLAAVLRYDLDGIEEEMARIMLMGPSAVAFDRIFQPVLFRVGELWANGKLSVGQEHMLSEVLTGMARQVLRMVQPPGNARRVLLACFAGEMHILPLIIVAMHFAQWGYRTMMLGAHTPPEAIGEAVKQLSPDLVGLSVTIDPPAERAQELVAAYAGACGEVPWVVGGAAAGPIKELVLESGGIVLSQDLVSVQSILRKLMS